MDGEEITMLQRSADIIKAEVGDISPEAVAAFLYILSQDRVTIAQLSTALMLLPAHATRTAIELSGHQGGVGLVNVDLDGDMYRVISLNEKSINFAQRLGYVLRN